MVELELIESVMEVRRVSRQIPSMDMVLQGKVVTNISVNRPQSGRNEEEKIYDNLTAEVQSRKGKCFVLGDFNGHVGSTTYGHDGVYGGFGRENATGMTKEF